MKGHFYLSVHSVNQQIAANVGFFRFTETRAAEDYLQNWLEKSCGLDCLPAGETSEAEMTFLCPKVEVAKDLEEYNGYHYFGSGGAVSLFVMALYNEDSALKFSKEITREFQLDSTFSDEADLMMDMLSLLARSFAEAVDDGQAVAEINRLLRQEGLSLF